MSVSLCPCLCLHPHACICVPVPAPICTHACQLTLDLTWPHLLWLPLPACLHNESDEWPVGALIISIQAACTPLYIVHHALLYSTKGSFNPPRLKPGVFSKANWGNYDVVSQKGTVTAVKCASVFLKRIQALKDQQWIDIYATALENHEMDNEVGSGDDGVRLGTSSEDELLDPLYDDIPA
ncbi:hypothetical protein BJV74DRAFT_898106 [Russula compacta]|nr:hypothetical protein BJV74DRAFT_898106 [Russula compacta]